MHTDNYYRRFRDKLPKKKRCGACSVLYHSQLNAITEDQNASPYCTMQEHQTIPTNATVSTLYNDGL